MSVNYNHNVEVKEGYVYIFGYDLVNGSKFSHTPQTVMLKKNEVLDYVNAIKAQHPGKDVMLYKKERF